MPVTQWGIVYYVDDPQRKVFRIVYPEFDDSELDGPVTDGNRAIITDKNGAPYAWTTFGTNPSRVAILEKVPVGSPRARFEGQP